jgi:hypothetical protein
MREIEGYTEERRNEPNSLGGLKTKSDIDKEV